MKCEKCGTEMAKGRCGLSIIYICPKCNARVLNKMSRGKPRRYRKVTEFEGYLSGDYECFCLSKVPFEEWVKINLKRIEKHESVYPDPLLLYPDEFFPKVDESKKWKFRITVEMEEAE